MKALTYVFNPLVHAPWGETQITLVTRAENYWDARRNVQKELEKWKKSQVSMQRSDFPWLDQLIVMMMTYDGGFAIGLPADKDDKVLVNWYDEREDTHRVSSAINIIVGDTSKKTAIEIPTEIGMTHVIFITKEQALRLSEDLRLIHAGEKNSATL